MIPRARDDPGCCVMVGEEDYLPIYLRASGNLIARLLSCEMYYYVIIQSPLDVTRRRVR